MLSRVMLCLLHVHVCSCGFAGCCLIRLTMGIHHYPDIQSIQDPATRVAIERACLQLGQQLLLLRAAAAADRTGSSSGGGNAAAAAVAKRARCSDAQAGLSGLTDAMAAAAAGGLSIEHVRQLVRDATEGWLQ
jgi:hypothetical protein